MAEQYPAADATSPLEALGTTAAATPVEVSAPDGETETQPGIHSALIHSPVSTTTRMAAGGVVRGEVVPAVTFAEGMENIL